MKFCVHIYTFHALSIKIILSEITTNLLNYGVKFAKPGFCAFSDM